MTEQTPFEILIVEDSQYDYRLIKRALKQSEFQSSLTWVQRGETALEQLKSINFDVVLLDFKLPGMSGMETFKAINEQIQPCPVIFITGAGNESVAVEALKLGAIDYLVKDQHGDYLQLVPLVINKAYRQWQEKLDRLRMAEALRLSEERYALAARGANDGLWDWNLESEQVYFAPRWKQMIGYQDDEIGTNPSEWLERVHPYDIEALNSALRAHWDGLITHFEHEYRLRHKDGEYRWMRCRGLAVRNQNGHAYRMVGSQTDITEQKVAQTKLMHNAYHDALTNLPNRRLFMDQLRRAMSRSWQSQRPFALLYLDLDGFKKINDNLGHLAGDQLLIAVARRLETCIRPTDIVARLGGDEFAMFLNNVNSPAMGEMIAKRIQESISTPFYIDNHDIFITASIGLAFSSTKYDNAVDMLRDADIAMYRAKHAGKARHTIFDPELHLDTLQDWQITQDLRHALADNHLQIVYQPIMSCSPHPHLTGVEALIRWHHPQHGLLSPQEFIPHAEESGLIVPISRWVLEQACQQLQQWHQQGYPDLTLAINISYRQFEDEDLKTLFPHTAAKYNIPPQKIHLEITESLSVRELTDAFIVLADLRQLGFCVSIDDFGLGSAFSCLAQFPLDLLKIDQSFIRNWTPNNKNSAIVSGLIQLAHAINLKVIAEGVETKEQLAFLQKQGCDYIQGYYFSPPINPQQLHTFPQSMPQ
ncbi:MAG TPA: EAL domain-containing protein [Anaerolineae bacterium]|nr:EAL domain-containing protein [Anaerolineae bacterium]